MNVNIKTEEFEEMSKIIIERKYKLINKIGEGAFGIIFNAINIQTNEYVAIKIEKNDREGNNILLKNEARMYKLLDKENFVPKFKNYGKEGKFNYLIMENIGQSLEQYKKRKINIPVSDIILFGIQMFKIIKKIHDYNIIHRDLKPENFLIDSNKKLYIIDFGLSKLYNINGIHIKNKIGRKITGTINYSSVNVHLGFTPSRRDDIESICYILLYLFVGKLPWFIKVTNSSEKEKRNELILQMKTTNCLWEEFENVTHEILLILFYTRKLEFEDEPDYNYILNLLVNYHKHLSRI